MSQNGIEAQILQFRDDYKFQTVDHTVSTVLDYFDFNEDDADSPAASDLDDDLFVERTTRFIPEYQRAYAWNSDRASYFIESIFLGIPTQYIFLGTTKKDNELSADTLEIIDGSQRIRTIYYFCNNNLVISDNIQKLTELRGKYFKDLPSQVQSRFKRRSLRAIEIENMDINMRKDLFRRLNEGVKLEAQEKRKGAFAGLYYNFISELAESEQFKKLCPLSKARIDKEKNVEYVNKFFTYLEVAYTGRPTQMLDQYMQKMVELENYAIIQEDKGDTKPMIDFENTLKEQKKLFYLVLDFVEKNIGSFALDGSESVSGQRFEGIAIGVAFALKAVNMDYEKLKTQGLRQFVTSKEYIDKTRIAGGSNNASHFEGRVNPIKNFLLGK